MLKLKEKLRLAWIMLTCPIIVVGIALFMLLFGDPVEETLEEDC